MSLTLESARELDDESVKAIVIGESLEVPDGLNIDDLKSRGFEGKLGQSALISHEGKTVLILGSGKDEIGRSSARKMGAALTRGAWRISNVGIDYAPLIDGNLAQAFAEGVLLASYQFNNYKSESKPCQLSRVLIAGVSSAALNRANVISEATTLARDLINEPANVMTPTRMAEIAEENGARVGLSVMVWDQNKIESEGLGGLLGLSKGSHQPPRLIRMNYSSPKATKTVALVGKGITFDSGGLSLKPNDSMLTMKTDMSGASAVLASMIAIGQLKPDVNVIGILCCTENMPGGGATKLGDVLKMRNGKTVEVVNTDAEGRLVLGDGLALAVEAGANQIIDIATLTGAVVVALGKDIAGIMGNNDQLIFNLREAGEKAGESYWQLPLPDDYKKHIESEIADIKNLGKGGEAGATAAALFLEEFVSDTPWAHLDIAGTAQVESDEGFLAKGATGFGVRTFIELLCPA